MANIGIHSSSSPRALLEKAAELLLPDCGTADPLQPRWVIQPGRIWEQALRRRLADKGIAASLTFGSLRLALERAFRLGCPGQPLMDEDGIFWNLLSLLLRHRNDPTAIGLGEKTSPAAWLKANEGDASLARVRLARLLKGILDDHASYRPAEVLGWLKGTSPAGGDEEKWIAALSQQLWSDERAPRPLAMQLPALLERILSDSTPVPGFPASVVAILSGAQPPAYLEGLGSLAKVCPVHLLVLETCDRGLADSMSTWGKVRKAWSTSGSAKDLGLYLREQKWLVPGTLQAYWGDLGITLQQQLVDLEESLQRVEIDFDETQLDAGIGGDTALQVLQRDIRECTERRSGDKRLSVPAVDESLVLVNAPSPLRELEGARDAIRGALQKDSSLRPSDVVMILAFTERYAPLLPAVFGSEKSKVGPDGLPRIPWHLADRSLQTDSDIMAALLEVMAALRDRITLPIMSDLLAQPAIQAKLRFSQDESTGLVEHLNHAGFRWGLNRQDRAAAGQPGKDDGLWTLDFALRRLTAGFLHPDRLKDPVGGCGGVTPLAAFEGSGAAGLERFIRWAAVLEQAREAFCNERPVDDGASGPGTWLGWMQEWMPQLVEMGGEREGQSVWLAGVTHALAVGAARLGKGEQLTADAFLALLESAVTAFGEALPIGKGMGGMIVASPRMARVLPARVIVVVGLSDGVWPKHDPLRPRGLLATPQAGDRMRRDEDRLATLEWVLSADDMLVWTWQGRDQQNGQDIPPSVVVGELMDVCKATFKDSECLVRKQPLHAFDPACFQNRHRSFDRIAAAAATNLRDRTAGRGAEGAAGAGNSWVALPLKSDLWDLPGLLEFVLKGKLPPWTQALWARFAAELVRFWRLPCQAFLKHVGIHTEDEYEFLPDREALKLDGLAGWGLRDALISGLLAGTDESAVQRQRARAGLLPPGKAGEEVFLRTSAEAADVVARARELSADVRPLSAMTWEYTGRLVRVTAGAVGGKQLLQARIEQIVLAAQHGQAVRSTVVGKKERVELPEVGKDDSLLQLRQLSALAILGTAFPLPFFPGVSSKFEAVRNGVACAEDYWNGPHEGKAESEHPACRIAFRGLEPLEVKLPAAPKPTDHWGELLSICNLDKGNALFEELALSVYSFMGEMRQKSGKAAAGPGTAREQGKDATAGAGVPPQAPGGSGKTGKAKGRKEKKS